MHLNGVLIRAGTDFVCFELFLQKKKVSEIECTVQTRERSKKFDARKRGKARNDGYTYPRKSFEFYKCVPL